jgi:hypothetical protein
LKHEGPPGLPTDQGGARPYLQELVHGSAHTQKKGGQRREPQGAAKLEGERAEKEEELTTWTRVCSGKTEEDRNGLISPETGEEEVDVVVAVVVLGSIP